MKFENINIWEKCPFGLIFFNLFSFYSFLVFINLPKFKSILSFKKAKAITIKNDILK